MITADFHVHTQFSDGRDAIGAVAAGVSAQARVEIRSGFGADGTFAHTVHAADRKESYADFDEAVEAARRIAARLAEDEARRRGAMGELTVDMRVDTHQGRDRYGAAVDLGTTVTATASGRLRMD